MVEPSFAQRTVIYHDEYFIKGKIVTSPAVGVTENGVMTADGNTHAYDYLVIATGHMDSVPDKKSDRLAQYLQGKYRFASEIYKNLILIHLCVLFSLNKKKKIEF